MEDKLYLKRGLITQSLSPVFALLIIRHMHLGKHRTVYKARGIW